MFSLIVTCAAGLAQTPANNTVTGTVLDEKGQKAPRILVCAYGLLNVGSTCGVSGQDGSFAIRLRSTGSYLLAAEKRAPDYVSPFRPFFRHPSFALPEVNVGGKEAVSDVIVRLLPKNGFLAGKVVDGSTGLPVDNARFQLCHFANLRVCHSTDAKSADGTFRIAAPHVSFIAEVDAKGYELWSSSDGGGPMTASSGEGIERNIVLKRKPAFADRAMHESEKREGIHLAAPFQTGPEDGTKFDIFPRSTRLEWNAVPEALSYFVEVDMCSGQQPVSKGCVNPQTWRVSSIPANTDTAVYSFEYNFVGAQPGRWRVTAIDANGIDGFKSPWRTIFYTR